MWFQQLFSRFLHRPKANSVSSSVTVTDEIIEFLITPSDIEVSEEIVAKLAAYTDLDIELIVIPDNQIIRF